MILTIMNDKEKSGLSDVEEKSIEELSQLINSFDSVREQPVGSTILSNIGLRRQSVSNPRAVSAEQ